MMLVKGIEEVKIQWIRIEKHGYKLYGFLLYTGCDDVMVRYMEEGMYDLDNISGKDCAIFLIEPPSARWLEYTLKKNHPWRKIFFNNFNETTTSSDGQFSQPVNSLKGGDAQKLVENVNNSVIVLGNNVRINGYQLLSPDFNILYDRSDAFDVVRYFNMGYEEVPCLIFFRDLNQSVIWKKPLTHFTDISQLKIFFRTFFGSEEFNKLLNSHY